MSIIGIWGPSALGKTYWLSSCMDGLAQLNNNLVVVLADNSLESHYKAGAWEKVRNNERWKRTKEEKLSWPPYELMADQRVWLIESHRYFGGIQPEFVAAWASNGGRGLYMLNVWAQPDLMRDFLKRRCDAKGKEFNSGYWDYERAKYENLRALNSAEKWLKPAGIPYENFEIDPERRKWNYVTEYVSELLQYTGGW